MLEPASIVSLFCEDVGQGCKHITVKRARGRSARIIHSIQPLEINKRGACPAVRHKRGSSIYYYL